MIMEIANISILQLALIWIAGSVIALVGAMVKGGGKLVISYLLVSILLGPIALVMLLFDDRKCCPFCNKVLKPSFKTCPFCDHRLVYADT
jgi:hypothetical protein